MGAIDIDSRQDDIVGCAVVRAQGQLGQCQIREVHLKSRNAILQVEIIAAAQRYQPRRRRSGARPSRQSRQGREVQGLDRELTLRGYGRDGEGARPVELFAGRGGRGERIAIAAVADGVEIL